MLLRKSPAKHQRQKIASLGRPARQQRRLSCGCSRMGKMILALPILFILLVNLWIMRQGLDGSVTLARSDREEGIQQKGDRLPPPWHVRIPDYPKKVMLAPHWLDGITSFAAKRDNTTNTTNKDFPKTHPAYRPTDASSAPKAEAASSSSSLSHLEETLRVPIPQTSEPTHSACQGYQGILHIAMGDIGGAAGTVFFQFVVAQLLYAERYNLVPYIHLNNVSWVVYDELVHGRSNNNKDERMQQHQQQLRHQGTLVATDITRPVGHWRDHVPGPPILASSDPVVVPLPGTGVWAHYFAPLSAMIPGDASCTKLPYMTLTLKEITPGLHGFASWAPRCWRYKYLPDYVTQPHLPWTEWLTRHRVTARRVVRDYIHIRPPLLHAAQRVNPHASGWRVASDIMANREDGRSTAANSIISSVPIPPESLCLGLHIRHSDKAAGRRVLAVEEFLPFVLAFFHAGGSHVYLATDSTLVLQEIQQMWPAWIQQRIRTLDGFFDHAHGRATSDGGASSDTIIRSNNFTAIFEMTGTQGDGSVSAQHHRTNVQVLVEILALAHCTFLVHGHSAVSEAALWMAPHALHRTSVNLEDEEHVSPASFGVMVQMIKRGEGDGQQITGKTNLPHPPQTNTWWKLPPAPQPKPSLEQGACLGFKGVLHIAVVGDDTEAGSGFFSRILNQLLYAETYQLMPWIHLEEHGSKLIFDPKAHLGSADNITFTGMFGKESKGSKSGTSFVLPGAPKLDSTDLERRQFVATGNGVWRSYFEPSSTIAPDDTSCRSRPWIRLDEPMVRGLTMQGPGSVRPWRFDDLPEHLWWKPKEVSLRAWSAVARRHARGVVEKYYHFLPYIQQRGDQVNPVQPGEACLAVHLRNGDKPGKFRKKIQSKEFLTYLDAYVRAGGTSIYISSDSHRALQYVERNFPAHITALIHSQGKRVVRTVKEWPTHMSDDHHRVNSETLVDIYAMSKCPLLLHGYSTVAEAAIYFNAALDENSVNLEDPDRFSASQFEIMARKVIQKAKEEKKHASQDSESTEPGPILTQPFLNCSILYRRTDRKCRSNAIVYLAQKKHSSYGPGRDSYGMLLRSIDLLHQNYLSIDGHLDNTDILIFHSAEFNRSDLEVIENRLGPEYKGVVRFVDLQGSPFWRRPKQHENDIPEKQWYAFHLFSEGYRRMMHWFAIDIWDFFQAWAAYSGCNYRYIFRMDEDSFLHSPIGYDIFDFMQTNKYLYGFRMCAYEMKVIKRWWAMYSKRNPEISPNRPLDVQMCGIYNNFFVADVQFFQRPEVAKFLRFIDRQGPIYRRRLGDLMIHSMSVYAFAPPERIHRFLDFTYEHSTVNKTTGCLMWGGIQAGYLDANATQTMDDYYQTMLLQRNCTGNASVMDERDLSPTYAHIPQSQRGNVLLRTITAGHVEFPLGKGVLSG